MKVALILFRGIRTGLFVLWSGGTLWLLLSTFSMGLFPARAQIQTPSEIINEHRTTVLETNYSQLHEDMMQIRTLVYWMLFGTVGLTGEAGARLGASIVKRNRGLPDV
jgi:hypothetical protein